MTLFSISVLLCNVFGSHNSVTGTIASLCNVGPSIGDIGSLGNFNAEPASAKIMYTIDMFMGRVEIYPVLAVLMMFFSKSSK